MTDQGDIRTCFLTARLPRWAGVRQNVVGSNISGGVVDSPETLLASRSNAAAAMMTLRNIATSRQLEEQVETLLEQNLDLTAQLNALLMRVNAIERQLADMQRDLEPIIQQHNAII
ncbi:IX [Bovine mastadenovirus A]|uniref:IX n=1 Tax=Bovine mastadenovirus A TaxID=129953 RepID=UPI0000443F89|nr:IX [Bovine mastadenovirus A]